MFFKESIYNTGAINLQQSHVKVQIELLVNANDLTKKKKINFKIYTAQKIKSNNSPSLLHNLIFINIFINTPGVIFRIFNNKTFHYKNFVKKKKKFKTPLVEAMAPFSLKHQTIRLPPTILGQNLII